MDNQTGLAFLNSVLTGLVPDQKISGVTDVKDLHKYLMVGCNKDNKGLAVAAAAIYGLQIAERITGPVGVIAGGVLGRLIYKKLLDERQLVFGSPVEGEFAGGLAGRTSTFITTDCSPSLLDEQFHYDFTKMSDKGAKKFFRGGLEYIRPCGWQRYALKVKGKYPDDIWLQGKTPRADQYSSAEDEWAVSYHGTSLHNGLSIAEEGYKLSKGERFLYGKGIYSAPDIEVASKFAATVTVNGKTYRVVMQNRVNPKNVIKIAKAENTYGEYWILPNEADIRP